MMFLRHITTENEKAIQATLQQEDICCSTYLLTAVLIMLNIYYTSEVKHFVGHRRSQARRAATRQQMFTHRSTEVVKVFWNVSRCYTASADTRDTEC
jgi:hypothetical protein